MAGGIECDGHEFGIRPADLHPHKVGFFMKYHQSCLEHARTHARTANAPPGILLQDEILGLIDKVIIISICSSAQFRSVFIHDCFELHDEYFQEYPRSRSMVTSRNIPERVPFKWLKAIIYGKRRT